MAAAAWPASAPLLFSRLPLLSFVFASVHLKRFRDYIQHMICSHIPGSGPPYLSENLKPFLQSHDRQRYAAAAAAALGLRFSPGCAFRLFCLQEDRSAP